MATKPEEASATPTFAVGHFAHHPSMTPLSVVASLSPLVVNGALPDFSGPWPFQQAHEPSGLGQQTGRTDHPKPANWRATETGWSLAVSMSLSVRFPGLDVCRLQHLL